MKKIYTFLIIALALTGGANAQSPAQNQMPDGSHDMYLGLGVMSRPLYEGAEKSKRVVTPVMQMQWSNGIFLAGMSAGWHLSNQYQHEFGPLISVEPSRTSSGVSNSIQFPTRFPESSLTGNNGSSLGNDFELGDANLSRNQLNKLENAEAIRTRLLFGGFYNYQITSNWRQSNTLLFGAGNNKQGIRLISDLRYQFKNGPAHHQFTVGMGVTTVNRAYANSYFGVKDNRVTVKDVITPIEINYVMTNPNGTVSSITESKPINLVLAFPNSSTNKDFIPRAGIKDVHADIFWNWSLSSSWLLTSKLSVSKLVGNSSRSPLVERKTNVTVSSAIAYRF